MTVAMYKLPLFVALILVLLSHLSEGSGDERCLLDDDQTNTQLESCLQDGERFISLLLDKGRAPTRRRKRYDLCPSFSPFKQCFGPILENCSELRHRLHSHWKIIYDVVNCACNNTPSCKDSLNCFMDQLTGKLGRECDARYRFNSRQETQNRCHFLYDNVRCKEALVESACSPEGGVFAFHVAKIANRLHIREYGCVITREKEYTGFRYTNQCPANLTTVLEQCERDSIRHKLNFRKDFDLVPDAPRRGMRAACEDYQRYKECTNTLKQECEHGLRKVYDFDERLRTYLLKMEFICFEGKKGFSQHLRCYKEVLNNNSLTNCNHIWDGLSPHLHSATAYHFYCLPESNSTKSLRTSLRVLRECYEDTFTSACGDGGKVIAELMQRVFEDPRYLRYRFKPNCELHQGAPYATTGVPPKTTTTRAPRVATRKTIKVTPRTNNVEPKYVVQDRGNGASSSTRPSLCLTSLVATLLASGLARR